SVNLITLLACLMLPLVGLNAWIARRQLHRLEGKRLLEEPVFAGTPFALEVELHNPTRTRRIGVNVEESGWRHRVSWFVATLAGRAPIRARTRPLKQNFTACGPFAAATARVGSTGAQRPGAAS